MRKITLGFFIAVLGLSLGAPCASAALFDIAGPAAYDVDTNPASNVVLPTAQTGNISDLNIQIIFGYNSSEAVSETYWGNFDITLNHGGTDVILMNTIDDKWGNYNVAFDDAAVNVLPDESTAPSNLVGTFKPVGTLSSFNGMDLSGDWTLNLLDDYIPGDGSDLISWRIYGTTDTVVPEPATILLFSTGLIGLLSRKRRNK